MTEKKAAKKGAKKAVRQSPLTIWGRRKHPFQLVVAQCLYTSSEVIPKEPETPDNHKNDWPRLLTLRIDCGTCSTQQNGV